jgi:hypothetical protein
MNAIGRLRKASLVVLAALAMVLVVSAPSQARGAGGSVGGHSGGAEMHHGANEFHGSDGHRGFDRHHDFGRRDFDHDRFGFGLVVPFPDYGYYYPAPYASGNPGYWYYCPSYGAYYPSVASCPEAWVPVPGS